MADLSDADKRTLLGAGYKEAQATRDVQRGVTDETRLAKSRQEVASNLIAVAAGFGVIAFLIGLANYFSRGTPYNPALVIGCLVVVIASAATVAWFKYRKS